MEFDSDEESTHSPQQNEMTSLDKLEVERRERLEYMKLVQEHHRKFSAPQETFQTIEHPKHSDHTTSSPRCEEKVKDREKDRVERNDLLKLIQEHQRKLAQSRTASHSRTSDGDGTSGKFERCVHGNMARVCFCFNATPTFDPAPSPAPDYSMSDDPSMAGRKVPDTWKPHPPVLLLPRPKPVLKRDGSERREWEISSSDSDFSDDERSDKVVTNTKRRFKLQSGKLMHARTARFFPDTEEWVMLDTVGPKYCMEGCNEIPILKVHLSLLTSVVDKRVNPTGGAYWVANVPVMIKGLFHQSLRKACLALRAEIGSPVLSVNPYRELLFGGRKLSGMLLDGSFAKSFA